MREGGKWDSIVIGSGLGGLSAAAYLAACGQRTLVLERYDVLGGSSHVFRRKRQWEFDVGVHYIGDCGPGGQVSTLVRGLGLDDRIEFLPMDRDGFDTIIGPDFELRVPFGWDQFEANLAAAFPREERAVRRWASTMRRIGENIDRATSVSTGKGSLKLAARSGIAAPWLMAPDAALMLACGLSPKTMLALSVQLGAMATTPQVAPVVMHAGMLQNFVSDGAWYPRGGGQVFAAGFAEVIKAHGGELRTHASVEKVLVEGGRAVGVRLEGGEVLRADAVVSDADIKRTYSDLVGYEHLPRRVVRRNERWRMGPPLINAFFGVEVDARSLPNSNYYAIPSWDDATSLRAMDRMAKRLLSRASRRDPIEWARDFAANQPTFVQCSTRRDPDNRRSAPPGHAAIEAQTLAPSNPRLWGIEPGEVADGSYRKNRRYREIKEIITSGLLDRVEQAFPGARANLRWSELGSPATQERYTNSTRGGAFGLEPRISQVGPFRPTCATAIRGLYLAGTSTAWGPGTEGAMLSGVFAASEITGRDLHGEIHAGAVIADRSRLDDWGEDFDPLMACKRLGGSSGKVEDGDAEEARSAAPLELVS